MNRAQLSSIEIREAAHPVVWSWTTEDLRKYSKRRYHLTASMASPSNPITLDGRTLEGGGQLLRIALGLSSLTGTPIRIHDIRGNRSGGGGLKAQHLACVEWLAKACRANVEGAVKGSKEVLFVPGKVGELSPVFVKRRIGEGEGRREVYEAKLEIKSAGSTGLALQATLPFILFAEFPSPLPLRLTLSGGTNVSQSPSYEYITQVLLRTLERIGFPRIEAKLNKRGWSHGGSSIGNFVLEIPPRKEVVLPAFNLAPPLLSDKQRPRAKIHHLQATFIAPSTSHAHFTTSLKQSLEHHFPPPHYPSFTEPHGNLTLTLENSRNPKRMYFILVATVSYPTSERTAPNPPTEATAATFLLGRDWLYDRKLPKHASGTSHDADADRVNPVLPPPATELTMYRLSKKSRSTSRPKSHPTPARTNTCATSSSSSKRWRKAGVGSLVARGGKRVCMPGRRSGLLRLCLERA